jgi:hypothetical protein
VANQALDVRGRVMPPTTPSGISSLAVVFAGLILGGARFRDSSLCGLNQQWQKNNARSQHQVQRQISLHTALLTLGTDFSLPISTGHSMSEKKVTQENLPNSIVVQWDSPKDPRVRRK